MKGIPAKTGDFLKNAVREFPRTPYAGAKAINQFLLNNYGYGCDENIQQEKWARYPDEIKKFMTCQDAGIFNYLLAKQLGLDVVLVKFENFNNTDQPHLGALISGDNSYYLLSNNNLEKVNLRDGHYLEMGRKVKATELNIKRLNDEINKEQGQEDSKEQFADAIPEKLAELKGASSFSKISFLDISDVVNLIESSKGKEGFLNFFATGQSTSTYFVRLKDRDRSVTAFSTSRFLRINNNFLDLRKSFNFSGYFINLLFSENLIKLTFSSGINNSVLINPVDLYSALCDKDTRFTTAYKNLRYVEQPEDIKEKIENTWIRRRIAILYSEECLKHKRFADAVNNLDKVLEEGEIFSKSVYSKAQLNLAMLHLTIAHYIKSVKKEMIDLYAEKNGGEEKTPYGYAHLLTNDYMDAQQADQKSKFSKYHIDLVEKAKRLGLEYGLNP